jgi:hypothetical protein
MLLFDNNVIRKLNFAKLRRETKLDEVSTVYLFCILLWQMVLCVAWIVCGWRVKLMEEEFRLSINLFY